MESSTRHAFLDTPGPCKAHRLKLYKQPATHGCMGTSVSVRDRKGTSTAEQVPGSNMHIYV